ncbi:MAG: hypothetical protein E6G08_05265 [Actinobacteria bacterium]|nr:MAG: hypothetical protein E6G08_05265 [Actinomycetota bacterium]
MFGALPAQLFAEPSEILSKLFELLAPLLLFQLSSGESCPQIVELPRDLAIGSLAHRLASRDLPSLPVDTDGRRNLRRAF